jgi:exodeoxyribonuclease-3
VNGIRAVQKKGFVNWMQKISPDILCVQETKANVEQLNEELTKPKGYHAYWASGEKKGYSGVATFSKTEPTKVTPGFGIKEYDREGRVLITEYDRFVLLNIYFPNGKMGDERLKYKMGFYDATLEFCNKLKKRGKGVVISGDVNTAHKEIDLERPKANEDVSGFLPMERAWIDKLLDSGYLDTLREFHHEPKLYSWWDYKSGARDRNVGWRIDYHFISANMKDNLKDAYILPEVQGSDHCPVGIELKF